MTDDAIRLTTAPTADLCAQLDCAVTADALDGALADAGYARLDHGAAPGTTTVFTPMDPPAGLDPGHRAPALAYAHCLMHVAHADGIPTAARLRACVELALDVRPTDSVGEALVAALATYATRRDPGARDIAGVGDTQGDLRAAARGAYHAARSDNVLTDIGLERRRGARERDRGMEGGPLRQHAAGRPGRARQAARRGGLRAHRDRTAARRDDRMGPRPSRTSM